MEAVFNLSDVEITGPTLTIYRHISDESDRWLDQYFCSRCGSNIGLRLEAVPGIQSLSAGAFDDPLVLDDRVTVRHVFVRSKTSWANLPHQAEEYEAHFRQS